MMIFFASVEVIIMRRLSWRKRLGLGFFVGRPFGKRSTRRGQLAALCAPDGGYGAGLG